jgi:serine/threonine protein phosphatase 1
MGKTFVMGDMHGAYRALRQCLDRSAFDYKQDRLICLGDVCDGWPDTRACVEELLRIKRLTLILGNHDFWTRQWMITGHINDIWYDQGGLATLQSYDDGVPDSHRAFFRKALPYYLRHNKLFVHAGIDPTLPLRRQDEDMFLWDRSLAKEAMDRFARDIPGKLTSFDEVYIGHTGTGYLHPIQGGDVWLMDTGAGWSGVLSMMNIETKEVFTSDAVPDLYPGIIGRVKRA